jgi:hypothetical protein
MTKSEEGVCAHLWAFLDTPRGGEKIVSNCPPRKCCRGCRRIGRCNSECHNAQEEERSS